MGMNNINFNIKCITVEKKIPRCPSVINQQQGSGFTCDFSEMELQIRVYNRVVKCQGSLKTSGDFKLQYQHNVKFIIF